MLHRPRFRGLTLLVPALCAFTLGSFTLGTFRRAQSLRLLPVASGFKYPTAIAQAGDGSNRLFVAEQGGLVKIVQRGQRLEAPFLDIRALTHADGERGLLGLAFDPQFKTNGRFYIDYTDTKGDSVIARYRAQGNRASPDSAQVLLTVKQPYDNHNGGQLAFGPDGMLYVGLGDGGSAGDPQNNAQNLGSLLGKILRLDVRGDQYRVPQDNPFVKRAGARPEIWAYGLRNPWRFSFDRQTGDLFIADVGQNQYEEIDFAAKGQGGQNYGWRLKEAQSCFIPRQGCESARGLSDPVLMYDHAQGNAVTGGFVYRGQAMPELVGKYLYADFGHGTLWAATRDAKGGWTSRVALQTDHALSTFGEDEQGELYLADYTQGSLYQLSP